MVRVVVFIALAVPFLARADDRATRAELTALAGAWVAVGGEARGKQIPKDELPFEWTFKAGGRAVFADRKRGDESPFRYTVDASRNPRVIDVTYDGPVAALKGTRQLGIYKIEKDRLTICLTLPGATEKDRPGEFSTREGKVLLMQFKRATADE